VFVFSLNHPLATLEGIYVHNDARFGCVPPWKKRESKRDLLHNFAEISKNLAIDLKIISLDCHNNYMECLNVDDDAAKNYNILATSLNVLHNYFDGPNKIIFRSLSI